MDVNLKSKSLAGSLFEQFESLCRDIDEFVNQDTVKFVENQVQTVKKIYSNVVQVLPHPGDCVEPKSLEEDGEQLDMCGHVSNTNTVAEDQLYLSQGSIPVPSVRDSRVPIEDLIKVSHDEAESYLHSEEYSNVMIQNGEGSGVYDSTPVTGGSSVDDESFDNENFLNFMGVYNEDHRNSTVSSSSSSPALAAHEEGLIAISFSDDTECPVYISCTVSSFESKLKIVENSYSHENGNLSSSSATTDCEVNVDNSLLMDSPPSPCDAKVDDKTMVEDPYSDENGNLSSSSATTDCEVNVDNSLLMDSPPSSCDANEDDKTMVEDPYSDESGNLSSSSATTDCEVNVDNSLLMDSPPSSCDANVDDNTMAVDPYSDENGNLSSSSETTLCEVNVDNNMLMDSPPSSCDANADDSVLVKDSALDNNVIQTADFAIWSFENRHEQHNSDCHSEVVVSSETANTIEVTADLDTIDLSPDVKDDGRSVLPNINCGDHAPSHRVKNFRYYQKLIKEAFSSRKKLAKEYEQLGILYGDIDVESNQHFEPSFTPSLPSIANDATKTQKSQEMCETEWELL